MKRITFVLALVALLLFVLTPYSQGVKLASAQDSGYTIENVDHQIDITYSGNVVIRDTITINGEVADGFLIGFPYQYSSYVLKGFAFSSEEILPLSLDVQLGVRSGFYGAEVTFPTGSPDTFTVIFILSNALLTSHSSGFYLDFPAYPSLAQDAAKCEVTIVLPTGASVANVAKDDGAVTSEKFEKSNMAAFSYFPANATINISEGLIRQVTFATLNRVITLGIAGEIAVSDNYRIINNSTEQIDSLKFDLPINASNIVAKDELGTSYSSTTLSEDESANIVSANITLRAPLSSGQSIVLKIEYSLPNTSTDQTRFALNLELYPYFSYYIHTVSITVIPPEGARIVEPSLSSLSSSSTLDREIYQETLKIDMDGLSYVDHEVNADRSMQITYEYNSIWVSFRPTFWVWGLAVVGSVVVLFTRRPKAKPSKSPKIAVPKITGGKLGSEQVKTFVDAYEERSRLYSEVKTLTQRAQKGKMPRRQYKVQRRALELRIGTLSKTIAELKPTFSLAGGNYADLTRQLDSAEREVNSVETNLRIAEARQKTGELALEDYKKSTSELNQRKEKAESKINGILLRLREETR